MKDLIIFEDFERINWFKNFTKKEKRTIKAQFNSFPEKNYLNLAIFQIDIFEYNDCEDYHYLINKLINKVINRFNDFNINKINCLKKNKIELVVNEKKFKKSFRVNGSRFDLEVLISFLNSILEKNSILDKFYLLNGKSDIQYPVLIAPEVLNKAKELKLISII